MSQPVGDQRLETHRKQPAPHGAPQADASFFRDWLDSPYIRLIRDAAGLRGRERVLEAGCGGARFSIALAILGCRVTSLDSSPEMVRRALALEHEAERFYGHLGMDAIQGEIARLPFPNDQFDLVLNESVVEHWLDEAERLAVLREMVRVARGGGTVVVIVPNTAHVLRGWWRLTRSPGYRCPPMTRYTARKLRTELAAAGCGGVQADGFDPYRSIAQWPDWWPLRKVAGALNRLLPQPKWLRQTFGVDLVAWGRKEDR